MNLNNKIDELLSLNPFQLSASKKKEKLMKIIKLQIEHHLKYCKEYKNWFNENAFLSPNKIKNYNDVPFLPSSVFKYMDLKSVKKTKSKIIRSSGTSSNLKSKIVIDASTSVNQRRSLSKILAYIIGKKRKTFYVLDAKPSNDSRSYEINARVAGMQGYMIAANSIKYLLIKKRDKLILDKSVLLNLKKNPDAVLIGYTYMFWKHVVENDSFQLKKSELLNNLSLIHFGGWKKLSDLRIGKKEFTNALMKKLCINIKKIFDIYGFTEQLGTIYPSNGYGNCRVSSFSHVLVRDVNTLKILPDGESGFLQFISPIPLSYPGFSLLNDDVGKISKRIKGKNGEEELEFEVFPRLNKAVSRGCGDTLPENYYI